MEVTIEDLADQVILRTKYHLDLHRVDMIIPLIINKVMDLEGTDLFVQ